MTFVLVEWEHTFVCASKNKQIPISIFCKSEKREKLLSHSWHFSSVLKISIQRIVKQFSKNSHYSS